MQVLEAASIIGLIRRTQALTGRVGVVAGVLGLFRRDRVLAVGGYDSRMATEDIDLTWKLLLGGWQTAYEPRALVGMQVPASIHALWMQRKRWARGQGEVVRVHLAEVSRLSNHRMWLLSFEAIASLLWIVALAAALLIAALGIVLGAGENVFGFALGWGVAIALIATVQVIVALTLERGYDRSIFRALVVGALYPIAYWLLSGVAAIHSEVGALLHGPRESRVVWDIPRQELDGPRKSPSRRER